MTIFKLIEKLASLGIKVYKNEPGDIRIHIPDPVPQDARPLLAELRQRKPEAIEYLQWDDNKALTIFIQTLKRFKGQYQTGTLHWANKNQPLLHDAVMEAQVDYEAACRQQDMVQCRRAVSKFEQAVRNLIETYGRRLWKVNQFIE